MNRKVIEEFRTTGGKGPDMFEGKPLILVHHIGAKSGAERITPLVYFSEGDRIFVFASYAGADKNPAWYHNLVANPKATVELGAETFAVIARVLSDADRDEYYAKQSAVQPQFAEYQSKTTRIVPAIELVRV